MPIYLFLLLSGTNMFDNKSFSSLESLGEFGLIDHLTSHIKQFHKTTVKGVGDDAAVIEAAKQLVISTDTLAEGVHFDLGYTPLKHLGYKAVAVNLSDIAAMNALPSHITVSLALSSKFTLEAVEELYAGILLACDKYQVDLCGGDTVASKSGLIVTLTAFGFADNDQLVYRSGAGLNDLLCVTGDLGGAYLGLQMLEREKRVFLANPAMQPDLDGYDYIIGRQLKPEARVDVIQSLQSLGVKPTAMIDISDGLSSEILHLSKAGNTGFSIYEEKLPADSLTFAVAEELNLNITTCLLNGGEDYELLFTIKPTDYDKIKGHPDITVIGHCTGPGTGNHLLTSQGQQFDLVAQGWKAF